MWSVNEPASLPWTMEPIEPEDVLYEFDGPLTFTASFGPFEALFHHVGKRGNSDYYAVVETNGETIVALREGALSVRGALNRPNMWVVDLNAALEVQRYWSCRQEDFPEKLLPQRNVPLFAYMEHAPDSLEEANAYFSIAFTGDQISKKSIPFFMLKALIDNSYEAARRLLSPVFMAGAKSGTFDFPARAVAGSLIVSLDPPLINNARLRQRTADAVSLEEAQVSFTEQRSTFFEEAKELVAAANSGNVSDSLAEERFALLDNIQHIIPSDQNLLNAVVFSARGAHGVLSVVVNEQTGTKLHRAFKRIERQAVTDFGRVEIVNSPSKTFVYRSSRGKQVTCIIPAESFVRLEENGDLRNGSLVKVRGHLRKRPQRDEMVCELAPEFLPSPPPNLR
ncbi:hypothetical protein [Bradyrhizobium japonicum]|uniref:hypothetical protein n=1 Tax=Bradyrhizobium japonicum TaxID=375 RepID=UPI0020A1355B|nr:hypothetical protein [Bradyrhizobium japonicum]MCP1766325.1 hypothetical protein [Bradyrhizobium japonicum]MCP1788463.1 hypothetical protein [Bradyrhizobium japonicum]MCP1810338.1 hypothetical protein [Bradyrhizobium japonicum]MCP1819272.1 hypothetical protein [Bradyrhizobium japonicum]MCP1869218.1 hypothetical protein [Bradyrhizobium japonicum]